MIKVKTHLERHIIVKGKRVQWQIKSYKNLAPQSNFINFTIWLLSSVANDMRWQIFYEFLHNGIKSLWKWKKFSSPQIILLEFYFQWLWHCVFAGAALWWLVFIDFLQLPARFFVFWLTAQICVHFFLILYMESEFGSILYFFVSVKNLIFFSFMRQLGVLRFGKI